MSRVLKPETKTKPKSATVFVCPEPGCTKTLAKFSDFELHLDVGEHVVQNEPADLQHNIYDKLKRDWVAKLWSSNPALPNWFNMSSQRKICSRSKRGMGSGQGMKWSYSVFWKGKRLSNEEVWHRRENWTESFNRTGSKGHAQCENSR